MITGHINAFSEAIIPIHLRDISGAVHDFEAVLDTGFNGSLTLSPEVIDRLRIALANSRKCRIGRRFHTDFRYPLCTIIWDGVPRSILVSSVETKPLLRMRVQIGGLVEIVSVNDGGLGGLTTNR